MELDHSIMEKSRGTDRGPSLYTAFSTGRTIVVKYGGSAMVDDELKKQVIQDVVLLKLVGFKPIIVPWRRKGNQQVGGKSQAWRPRFCQWPSG